MRPSDPSPVPYDLPYEALEDLVAGRLDPTAARALEARIAAEPAVARAAEEIRSVARALGHEGLYACPSALLAAIVAEYTVPAWSLGRRALALAACVLLAVGALTALTGRLPAPDTPLLPALSAAPVVLPATDLLAQAPMIEGRLAPFAVALAGLLLAGGVLLARRWGVAAHEHAQESV